MQLKHLHSKDHDQPNFNFAFAISELESQDNQMLVVILKELGDYPLVKIADRNGMTLMHHAVLKGVEGKTQLLIDFVTNF